MPTIAADALYYKHIIIVLVGRNLHLRSLLVGYLNST
jgi:hypothetical protein